MKSLLQSKYWANFKRKYGWTVHKIGKVRVFEKKLPFGKSFFYIPEITSAQHSMFGIKELLKKIKPLAKKRKGVKVVKSDSPKDIEILYKLYQETAEREGFSPRSKKYFVNLFYELFAKKNGMFFIAMYQGRPIAALFVTFYDKMASYLYGGSSRRDRNVMAPYLLHWEVIKEAKKRGMKIYDLLAIAPREDQGHKHYGLRKFKQQFGGRQVNLVGGWDKVYSRFWYFLFKIAEKIRRR